MVAVITKVSYVSSDYDSIDEWVEEMETWKIGLKKQFINKDLNALPTILCISQDLTKPKRKENIQGTEQNKMMITEMNTLYAKAECH